MRIRWGTALVFNWKRDILSYLQAVGLAFDGDVDYARLVKVYGTSELGPGRSSPPECIECKKHEVTGNPRHRPHLNVLRGAPEPHDADAHGRFTRLTNAFSKKVENHEHAIALHFVHYNFLRRHRTLQVTPAMAAGIDRHLWSIEHLVSLID